MTTVTYLMEICERTTCSKCNYEKECELINNYINFYNVTPKQIGHYIVTEDKIYNKV